MKLVDGYLVPTEVQCISCNGNGQTTRYPLCPNYNRATHGKPCEHCGARRKYEHQTLRDRPQEEPCGRCEGRGVRMDSLYDYPPHEVVEALCFRVVDATQTRMGLVEQLLGAGLYSCTDYGAHRERDPMQFASDVMDEVQEHRPQAVKIADKDGRLCKYVAIVSRRDGYSVIGISQEGKAIQG